ncbi:ubiquitin-like-specific protease 1D isoform X1 [Senna tora]|uniref:Ubiquitin-like-specific protease 1D isoform X1 n=1 Tax=Senna tora TaxID=362788 RepID=A0A834TVL4_9FABA|nr:ubiquitin-like-specific protease 1D isoform X1 [Senna tora]
MEEAMKLPLNLDCHTSLSIQDDDDQPPPMLVLSPSSSKTTDSLGEPRQSSNMDPHGLQHLRDHELTESIQSKKHTLETMGGNLPDKGEKLRATIKRYEDELARRKLRLPQKEVDESEKPRQATASSIVGVSDGLKKENMLSQAPSESSFASCFYEKMEQDTPYRSGDALKTELSLLKHCGNQKMEHNGDSSQKGRKRDQSSSRQLPFQCASSLSKCDTSNDHKRRRTTSTRSLHNTEKNLSGCLPNMKDASQVIQLDDSRSRKGQAIVLDDEDETHHLKKTYQEGKLTECPKEAKIYYPSSDDPECVEICYADIDCLAPEGFLTSTIMNFYIRYLQQQASLTNRSISDYHFFNTYFYKKLKEAVSYKRSDRDTFFAKFRRWWKGVNLFQKALHWSLVIISFPDKKDESGPIILHLDSLRLHSSRSVCENIKSYLKEEWKYVDRECASSDIPIADKIWKNLSRRIEDKVLTVPQQKNEYDCGLFVLYFIERFIEEAPERLKKKDLNMVNHQLIPKLHMHKKHCVNHQPAPVPVPAPVFMQHSGLPIKKYINVLDNSWKKQGADFDGFEVTWLNLEH